MRIVDIIEKKRDGAHLGTEEIEFFVHGYTRGEIPDYQAAALLMAIQIRGMDDSEVRDLTMAMVSSGDVLDLSDIAPVVVDKHSTGGVGDKVSLVVAPVVAACGVPMGKMSGRGLGFSGGTLDKLESIPGFRCDLSVAEFRKQLREIGIVLTGQTANLAPADGKLYALRDVTGTVPSLPLIVASIMSKKIAGGANAIVLDVKVGSGAFMKTIAEARALAQAMVRIGSATQRLVTARISDMNQPLGRTVGNSLELCEAIDTLRGGGPEDLRQHCEVIASELLCISGASPSFEKGIELVRAVLTSGAALAKFRELVQAQGGDPAYVDNPERFRRARYTRIVRSRTRSYLQAVQTDEVGMAVVELGGGREKKEDAVDHSVGLVMYVRIGDLVEPDQPLCEIYANDLSRADQAERRLMAALRFSETPVVAPALFYDRIADSG